MLLAGGSASRTRGGRLSAACETAECRSAMPSGLVVRRLRFGNLDIGRLRIDRRLTSFVGVEFSARPANFLPIADFAGAGKGRLRSANVVRLRVDDGSTNSCCSSGRASASGVTPSCPIRVGSLGRRPLQAEDILDAEGLRSSRRQPGYRQVARVSRSAEPRRVAPGIMLRRWRRRWEDRHSRFQAELNRIHQRPEEERRSPTYCAAGGPAETRSACGPRRRRASPSSSTAEAAPF